MKYELHRLNARLPFIFRYDKMDSGTLDYTHWHENIEILWFRKGKGWVSCDYKRTEVCAGDIYVINSEKLHMIGSETLVEYYCFIVDTGFLFENGMASGGMVFEPKINDEHCMSCYEALVNAYSVESEFRETRIRACALELMIALAENHLIRETSDEVDQPHLQNVKQAIKYIKDNSQKHITLDEISKAAGLSRAYFSREFRRITGYTVTNYINVIRCRNAEKLLQSGKYRVNEAAAECGFENMSYFARTYRKLMGALPSDVIPDSE